MSDRGLRLSLGMLFDHYGGQRVPTQVHLSRPFDVAPDGGTSYSVEDLAELVATCSGWLHAAGVRPGERVAIVKDNHWDYVLLAAAAARIGAVPAMVSALMPAASLAVVLKRLDPALLVTTAAVLENAAAEGADLCSMARRTLSLTGPAAGALSVADVAAARVPAPSPRDPGEPMIVTHTSGTTGVPKLVVHSADTVVGALGRTESIRWPLVSMRRDDRVAMSIAFCHMRIITWTTGMLRLAPERAIFVAEYEPEVAERVLGEHAPTHVEALPATYLRWEALVDAGTDAFSRVRLYVSTFDAMHPPTVRRFLHASRRRYPVWLQGWGQSETGPIAFRLLHRRALARQGDRNPTIRNVGRPIPTIMKVKVVDRETFEPVRRGRPGLALVRTRGCCLDYVGEEDRWQAKRHDGGWWNTGDIVSRTRTGNYRLLDREVDVIPGTSCVEIEDVLADRIANVWEAVILGEPDRRPLPVVCTYDGKLDMDEWRHAISDLPEMDEPVVLSWEGLPRTGTGKVRRFELRERLGRHRTYGSGRWV